MHIVFTPVLTFSWGPNIYLTAYMTFPLEEFNMSQTYHTENRTFVTFLLNLLLTVLISVTSFTMYQMFPSQDLEIVSSYVYFKPPLFCLHIKFICKVTYWLCLQSIFSIYLLSRLTHRPWSLTWTVATASESIHLFTFFAPRIWFT